MSWFGFGKRKAPRPKVASATPTPPVPPPVELERRRTFGMRIAGALYHQPAIARFDDGVEHMAVLEHEPANAYDPNAVRVTIDSYLVGYVHSETAAYFVGWAKEHGLEERPFLAPAMVVQAESPTDEQMHLYVNLGIKFEPPRVVAV